MWRCAAILVIGCTATQSDSLAVEPSALDLDVDLALAPPSGTLAVYEGGLDITSLASFQLVGAGLGSFAGARFTSDGRTGGSATITVSVGERSIDVPVTATVHGRRGASDGFETATDVDVDAALEPATGEVLPPNLGGLDVDFAAADADDIHEIAVTAPFLDIRVYANGAPGPRHVALTADEWTAIARTAQDVSLAVRSMPRGGTQAHRATAELAIADLPLPPLVFSGAHVDATGTLTEPPRLWRYDPASAAIESFIAAPGTGCIGCHIAISADGKRIAAGGIATPGGALTGAIIDVAGPTVTYVDPASGWATATFDPGGALVTSSLGQGALVLRDGPVATTLAIGEPASGPAVSPDGGMLAYIVVDPAEQSLVGSALHVRPWNAATATIGAVRELVGASSVTAPQFSPDGAWLVYARTAATTSGVTVAADLVPAAGGAPIELNAGDGIPRWASAFTLVDGEPMAWIAMSAGRPYGAVTPVGDQRNVWLIAFYPGRGAVSRPFRLPGQSLALGAIHAPSPLSGLR